MSFREVANRTRIPRVMLASLLAGVPFALGACGEDDFENDPRPAIPVELTAAIDDRAVSLSPSTVGAGLVNITVSNQTDEPTRLTLEGPTEAATSEIPPGGTQTIKTTLEEGDYDVAASDGVDVKPDKLKVGPERPTSQNELLQP